MRWNHQIRTSTFNLDDIVQSRAHEVSILPKRGPRDFDVLEHAPSSRGIPAFFTRFQRASHFSLRGQREGTKRKATPHSRLTHSPCAPGPRACYGVRRQSIPGLASNWPTSCVPSFGLILRSLAAIEGTPVARIVRDRAKAPRQLLLLCAAQGYANAASAGCAGAASTSCIHAVVIRLRHLLLYALWVRQAGEGNSRTKPTRAGTCFVLAAQDAQ